MPTGSAYSPGWGDIDQAAIKRQIEQIEQIASRPDRIKPTTRLQRIMAWLRAFHSLR